MPDMAVPSLADGMGLETCYKTDFEEAEPGDFSTSQLSTSASLPSFSI